MGNLAKVGSAGTVAVLFCNTSQSNRKIPRGRTLSCTIWSENKEPEGIRLIEGEKGETEFWPEDRRLLGSLLDYFNLQDLPLDVQNATRDLIEKFSDIFVHGSSKLGVTSLVTHKIETGDASPIKKPPYRVPHSQRDILNESIEEMVKQNIIRPSNSPWSAPLLLVQKNQRMAPRRGFLVSIIED
jgi:hypothetical protein